MEVGGKVKAVRGESINVGSGQHNVILVVGG